MAAAVSTLSTFLFATAIAAQVSPSARSEAERRFEAGRSYVERRLWAEAANEFEASVRIQPSVGGLLNLGEAYEHVGRLASARTRFEEAMQLAVAVGDHERAEEARARIAEIASRVPTLTCSVRSPNVRLTLDRTRSLAAGELAFVDPGSHVVTAEAAGYRSQTTRIELRAGTHMRLEILDLAPESSTGRTSRETEATSTAIVPIALGAAGILGIGLGTFFGMKAVGARNDLDEACPSYPRCASANIARARILDDELNDNGRLSTIFFVGGALLTLSGVAIHFVFNARKRAAVSFAPERATVVF